MNMNENGDIRWQNLVALSAPTFAGDASPPYGFTTRFLAQLHAETRQRELVERIGARALFASLAMLVATLALSLGVDRFNRGDLEPGLRSIVQVEDIPVS